MTRDEAKELGKGYLLDYARSTLEERKAEIGDYVFNCPYCNSGKGHNGTPAFKIKKSDTTKFHCFSCLKSGDIYELVKECEGLNEFPDQLSFVTDKFHILVDEYKKPSEKKEEPAEPKKESQEEKEKTKDFILKAKERLKSDREAIEYLHERGFTDETIEKFNFGVYRDSYNYERVLIPYNKEFSYYTGRFFKEKDKNKKPKYLNKGEGQPIFNEKAINESNVIFFVEGPMCAISIMQEGGVAISTNTSGFTNPIRELIKKNKEKIYILCFDNNDTAGERGQAEAISFLKAEGILYIEKNIAGACKDPNELLQKNPAELKQNIAEAIKEAKKKLEENKKPYNVLSYIENGLLSKDIDRFISAGRIKTGFKEFDYMSGGLFPGLYAIGALSSLGKTTLIHQMGDQIAEGGNDVLFFSLEMSRLEMVSKSLAREMIKSAGAGNSLTGLKIRMGYQDTFLLQAVENYKNKVGDRMNVIEWNLDCTVTKIKEAVARHIKATGSKPVVIIDYLQIMTMELDKKTTTKEAIDNIVTELKRMSRDFSITVIVISSVNRSNYLTPISFESFKESGGIEYTADVVMGLQYKCLNEDLFSKEKNVKERRERIEQAKREEPARKIQLKVLKNRFGKDFDIFFKYYPQNDYFVEEEGEWSKMNGRTPFDD